MHGKAGLKGCFSKLRSAWKAVSSLTASKLKIIQLSPDKQGVATHENHLATVTEGVVERKRFSEKDAAKAVYQVHGKMFRQSAASLGVGR